MSNINNSQGVYKNYPIQSSLNNNRSTFQTGELTNGYNILNTGPEVQYGQQRNSTTKGNNKLSHSAYPFNNSSLFNTNETAVSSFEIFNDYTGEMHKVETHLPTIVNNSIDSHPTPSNQVNSINDTSSIFSSNITPIKPKSKHFYQDPNSFNPNYLNSNNNTPSLNPQTAPIKLNQSFIGQSSSYKSTPFNEYTCRLCSKGIDSGELVSYCSCLNLVHNSCLASISKENRFCSKCSSVLKTEFLNDCDDTACTYRERIKDTNINSIDSCFDLGSKLKEMSLEDYSVYMSNLIRSMPTTDRMNTHNINNSIGNKINQYNSNTSSYRDITQKLVYSEAKDSNSLDREQILRKGKENNSLIINKFNAHKETKHQGNTSTNYSKPSKREPLKEIDILHSPLYETNLNKNIVGTDSTKVTGKAAHTTCTNHTSGGISETISPKEAQYGSICDNLMWRYGKEQPKNEGNQTNKKEKITTRTDHTKTPINIGSINKTGSNPINCYNSPDVSLYQIKQQLNFQSPNNRTISNNPNTNNQPADINNDPSINQAISNTNISINNFNNGNIHPNINNTNNTINEEVSNSGLKVNSSMASMNNQSNTLNNISNNTNNTLNTNNSHIQEKQDFRMNVTNMNVNHNNNLNIYSLNTFESGKKISFGIVNTSFNNNNIGFYNENYQSYDLVNERNKQNSQNNINSTVQVIPDISNKKNRGDTNTHSNIGFDNVLYYSNNTTTENEAVVINNSIHNFSQTKKQACDINLINNNIKKGKDQITSDNRNISSIINLSTLEKCFEDNYERVLVDVDSNSFQVYSEEIQNGFQKADRNSILNRKTHNSSSSNDVNYSALGVLNSLSQELHSLKLQELPSLYESTGDNSSYIYRKSNSLYLGKGSQFFPVEVSIESGQSHICIPEEDFNRNSSLTGIVTSEVPISIDIHLKEYCPTPHYNKDYIILFNTTSVELEQVCLLLRNFALKMQEQDRVFVNIINQNFLVKWVQAQQAFYDNRVHSQISQGWLRKESLNQILDYIDMNSSLLNSFIEIKPSFYYTDIIELLKFSMELGVEDLEVQMVNVLLITDDDQLFKCNAIKTNSSRTKQRLDYMKDLKSLAEFQTETKVNYTKSFNLNIVTVEESREDEDEEETDLDIIEARFFLSELAGLFLGMNFNSKSLSDLLKAVEICVDTANKTSLFNCKLVLSGNKDLSVFLEAINYPCKKVDHNQFELFLGNLLLKEKKTVNLLAKLFTFNNGSSSLSLPLFEAHLEFVTSTSQRNESLAHQLSALNSNINLMSSENTKVSNSREKTNEINLIKQKTVSLKYSLFISRQKKPLAQSSNPCNSYMSTKLSEGVDNNSILAENLNKQVIINRKVVLQYSIAKCLSAVDKLLQEFKIGMMRSTERVVENIVEGLSNQRQWLEFIVKSLIVKSSDIDQLINSKGVIVTYSQLGGKDCCDSGLDKELLNISVLLNIIQSAKEENNLTEKEEKEKEKLRIHSKLLLFSLLVLRDLKFIIDKLSTHSFVFLNDILNIKDSIKYLRSNYLPDERFLEDYLGC